MRSLLISSLALLSAVYSAAAASSGCGKSPPSSGVKSTTVNGKNRQYFVQLPNNYNPSRPYKLVFAYHWGAGTMNAVVNGNYYALRPIAGDGTIFVAPEGINQGWGNSGGEDIKFTDQMLDYIKSSLCIDESQIFATGWSYGAGMSYSVACSRPNIFRAVAAIAGGPVSGCDGGTNPVAYLGIHGVADDIAYISQGRILRDKFLGLNGCAAQNAPEPGRGQQAHYKTAYSCRAGYPVTWIAHGGGHIQDPSDGGSNWAPGETWNFFTALPSKETGGTTSVPSSTTTEPSSTSTTGGNQPTPVCGSKWAQCGGLNWSGATCCESGSTCTFSNDWYSQCL